MCKIWWHCKRLPNKFIPTGVLNDFKVTRCYSKVFMVCMACSAFYDWCSKIITFSVCKYFELQVAKLQFHCIVSITFCLSYRWPLSSCGVRNWEALSIRLGRFDKKLQIVTNHRDVLLCTKKFTFRADMPNKAKYPRVMPAMYWF
jgi:hypothetical protein